MNNTRITLRDAIIIIIATIIAALTYIIGFDAGYSKSMDRYMDASECKPSWRWRQRF